MRVALEAITRKEHPAAASSTRSGKDGELGLIAALRTRKQKASKELRLGIGDDCAILRPLPSEEIVVTTDFSLENVHFRRDWHTPESVGHRCLARGLSDLAAMGARPIAAFLSLAISVELTTRSRSEKTWVERFFDGLLTLADQMKVPLAGGDTAESPVNVGNAGLIAADIVLIGGVKRARALLRSRAKAGDILYVTGPGIGRRRGGAAGARAKPEELRRIERRSGWPSSPFPRTSHRHRVEARQTRPGDSGHRSQRRTVHRPASSLRRIWFGCGDRGRRGPDSLDGKVG